uniref:ribosomal protein S7 n=1 Tax=Helicotheca tamesis TaxID=374047 RepID=UPI002029060E|nr:ribosomal protein S7 [Helicotheca tamesis]QYB23018.1 ribosomal protein S7 [Helicotheca tamesis]
MHKNILIKFLNKLTFKGKKFKSFNILQNSTKLIQKNSKKNHKKLFQFSVINISPLFNLKTIKKTKKNSKDFPFFINNDVRISIAIKFIGEKTKLFKTNLYKEIFMIMKNNSNLFQKKNNITELSYKNKKYANYRWF